jgi:hypothetical protein
LLLCVEGACIYASFKLKVVREKNFILTKPPHPECHFQGEKHPPVDPARCPAEGLSFTPSRLFEVFF